MVTKIKSVLGVCALGVCALGGNAAFGATCTNPSASYPLNGCTLDGLVAGSFPYFEQSVYVTLNNRKNGGFSLNASYTGGANDTSLFFVNNTDDPYQIDNTFYQLRAKYNSKKEELTGTIRIMGKVGGSNAQETLMTADLKGEWAIDGTLLGFNTMNIQCGPSITALVTCTNAEVAYLSLDSALYPGGDKGRTSTMGLAVTSVPVPAAAWLLGSGLVGFAGVARRKRT